MLTRGFVLMFWVCLTLYSSYIIARGLVGTNGKLSKKESVFGEVLIVAE
jgi:hypothetical protein